MVWLHVFVGNVTNNGLAVSGFHFRLDLWHAARLPAALVIDRTGLVYVHDSIFRLLQSLHSLPA